MPILRRLFIKWGFSLLCFKIPKSLLEVLLSQRSLVLGKKFCVLITPSPCVTVRGLMGWGGGTGRKPSSYSMFFLNCSYVMSTY